MKKALILILSLLGAYTHGAYADTPLTAEECINPDMSIEMTRVLVDILNIPLNELQLAKTQMVLLREEKINYAFADYLAKRDIAQAKLKLSELQEFREMFMDDNARNLIIEFTYFNRQNKKAVFIGSAIINDNECSVASGDSYIIVKREF